MNLHALASGLTGNVNPPVDVVVKRSLGAGEDASGRVVPQYDTPLATTGNKQSLTGSDIYRLQGQNVQGVVCKMYLSGNYEGLFRVLGKGGDLLIFENHTYLVAAVLERYPEWCCVALTMQLDGASGRG
jgi:hypothetical protein